MKLIKTEYYSLDEKSERYNKSYSRKEIWKDTEKRIVKTVFISRWNNSYDETIVEKY